MHPFKLAQDELVLSACMAQCSTERLCKSLNAMYRLAWVGPAFPPYKGNQHIERMAMRHSAMQ